MEPMRPETQRVYKERILGVLVHIQQHLDEPLALEDLARLAHFSPYHFHRIFQGMVGEGLWEHIRRLRLERAAQQLRLTDRPVIRVAFDAGYAAHEAFTRAFRAMFGLSPSQFRENSRQPEYTAVASGVHYSPSGGLEDFNPIDTGGALMDVEIKNLDPIRVAFVRHVGPYAGCGAAWEKLCAWAGPRGLFGPDTRFLGICHDDPQITPPEKIRYDACVTVGAEVVPEGEVGAQETVGGEYAVTLHRGPYEQLHATYERLCGEWLPHSGREPAIAPCFEVYLNDPKTTRPAELLTQIHMPLAAPRPR
jgi:AraC family transcriptional regulator